MTGSDLRSLDEVIAHYLDAADSGDQQNPEEFIDQWPQYRSEFLQFILQNKAVDRLIGTSSDITTTTAPGSLSPSKTGIEALATDYRIGQIIGRGGMGTVYEAIRISDNERVAIKILNQRTAADDQHQRRFDRESHAIESLDHPHIVPLYSVSNSQDTQYLVMKLIDGVNLSELVTQRADFSPGTAMCLEAAQGHDDYFSTIGHLIADVADALEAAHQSNIIHRDVKPSNLLLDKQGKIWLTDFGLASIGEGHATLTATGDIMGTPAYMSPEQAIGDHRLVDHRSDIYSLGATLYALATGRRPYLGTGMQVLREVSEGLLTLPSRFRRDIPRDLEAIILKAMSRNPAKRYQSAAEFKYDLHCFTGGRSVRAKSPGLIDNAVQWMSRNPRLTIAALISLSATVLSVILIQWIVSHRLTGLNDKLSNSNQRLSELNEDLVSTQRTLERNIYDADMSDAYNAYAQGDTDRVRELLARHTPRADRPKIAGFEWRLLDELSRPVKVRRIKGHSAAARDVGVLTGQVLQRLTGHDYSVESAAFSPCGQLIATAERYQDVLVHSIDGKLQHRLTTGSRNESLAFSSDGQHLLTVFRQDDPAHSQMVRAWDLKSMQPAFDLASGFSPMTFAFSESSKEIVVANVDHVAKMTFPDGVMISSYEKLRGRVRNVAISFDGTQHAAGCDNGLIYIWDLTDNASATNGDDAGNASSDMPAKPVVVDASVHGITSLGFVENGELVGTNSNGEILVCEPPRRNPRVRSPKGICCFVNSRSAPNHCFARLSDGAVIQFDAFSEESPQRRTMHRSILANAPIDDYETMALSPDETLIAVGTPVDLVVADSETGSVQTRIKFLTPDKVVRDFQFSANGDSLFALFNDRLVAYRTSDGSIREDAHLPIEHATQLSLGTEGSSICVVSESTLLIFDASTFRLQKSKAAIGAVFSTVAVSRSGQLLAVGFGDGTTHLVDASTLTTLAVFRGHRADIRRASFFNNDQSLMTFDKHGVLRLWDVTARREMGVLNLASSNCAIVEEKDSLVTWDWASPMRIWSAGKIPK